MNFYTLYRHSLKSSLADGHNIVLFDLNSAEVVGCQIHEVSKVQFEFKKIEDY